MKGDELGSGNSEIKRKLLRGSKRSAAGGLPFLYITRISGGKFPR